MELFRKLVDLVALLVGQGFDLSPPTLGAVWPLSVSGTQGTFRVPDSWRGRYIVVSAEVGAVWWAVSPSQSDTVNRTSVTTPNATDRKLLADPDGPGYCPADGERPWLCPPGGPSLFVHFIGDGTAGAIVRFALGSGSTAVRSVERCP